MARRLIHGKILKTKHDYLPELVMGRWCWKCKSGMLHGDAYLCEHYDEGIKKDILESGCTDQGYRPWYYEGEV